MWLIRDTFHLRQVYLLALANAISSPDPYRTVIGKREIIQFADSRDLCIKFGGMRVGYRAIRTPGNPPFKSNTSFNSWVEQTLCPSFM